MTHASGFRHPLGYLATMTLLMVAGHAAAEVSNIDPEQQRAPDDVLIATELQTVLVDQGALRDNAPVLHGELAGRTMFGLDTPGSRQGFSAQVDAYFAVGEDTTADPKIDPAELVQFETKVSYLYEMLDKGDIPVFTIIPTWKWVTYPTTTTTENYLKWREHWLGSDFWWMAPVEGLEFGGGTYWDPVQSAHMIKGTVGAREFYQDAPFDVAGWELFNFGSNSFKRYFAGSGQPAPASPGTSHAGFSTLDFGGKVTTPLPWKDTWTYIKADWSYWMMSSDRAYLNKTGRDAGEFIFSIGGEWRPE